MRNQNPRHPPQVATGNRLISAAGALMNTDDFDGNPCVRSLTDTRSYSPTKCRSNVLLLSQIASFTFRDWQPSSLLNE